jgi:Lrp/AsnC family transcriptional regulator, leucine-responsive regulatory protein
MESRIQVLVNTRTMPADSKNRQPDRIDLKILKALQDNARLSYVELAQRVGLSTTPCMERVKRLEANGYIQGYHAQLNAAALGLELIVFLEITLASQSPQAFTEFRKAVEKQAYVQECHLISGQSDYLLKLRLTDLKSYRKYLGELLLALPHVRESKSHIVMEDAKQQASLPLDLVGHRFKN